MKILILISSFLFFSNWNTYCQVGIVYLPMVVTDVAVTAESALSLANYNTLKSKAYDVANEAFDYRFTYNNRIKYLFGFIVTNKINNTIDEVENRINALEVANTNLISVLNYSKKKKNIELIDDVKQELDVLKTELNRNYGVLDTNLVIDFEMSTPVSIYGERLNLYYNMSKTTTRIHRILDIIEGNIGGSVDYDTHVGAMKTNNTTTVTY